jgi:hypothetical protein
MYGPGSVVGIKTGYGLDGPRIESRWGARFSASGAHPASRTMGTGSFPEVKSGQGVTLTPHPLLVPRPRKGRAIPLPSLFLYIFLKSIIVYRHTGCGTCQDSRYNIVIHEYYTLYIDKDTYYVSRYIVDTYYVSRYNIVKHECYTLHIDIDTYSMCRTGCTEPQCLYKGALYLFILYVIVEDVLAIPGYNLQCSLDMVCTYIAWFSKLIT